MASLNKVMLIGNIGKEPEVLKTTEAGSFVRLNLATNKRYTNDKGEVVQDTQWHSVYVSNGPGKFAATHIKKGNSVYVEGELRRNTWTDKEGINRSALVIYAHECKLLEPRQPEQEKAETLSADDTMPEDDIFA